ncbi:cytochrome P450 [Trichoderma camerunense]
MPTGPRKTSRYITCFHSRVASSQLNRTALLFNIMLVDFLTHPSGPSVVVILCVIAVGVALVEAILPGVLPRPMLDVVSAVLNKFLLWQYPIKSVNSSNSLPTCPYRWPNGQGDGAKFMDGIQNSVAWFKKYGHLYRIWSGMSPEIVLTQPEQLQIVFHDSDKHKKAINNDSGYFMGQLLGQCVGLISPPQWQGVRTITEVPFRHQTSIANTGVIEEFVCDYFSKLEIEGNLSRGMLHPTHDLKMLPFWVVCYFLYGRLPVHMTEALKDLVECREELMRDVIKGGISRFSFSRLLPTAANRRLREFKDRWLLFNRTAEEYARTHGTNCPIISMFDAVRLGTISEDQLLQTLDETLFANLDVTTGGLAWNPVFLAAYPTCQQRLRQEMQDVLDQAAMQKYLQNPSTYLQACILESSRLRPLAAFSVPQSAPTPRVLDGYIIPASTNFIVDAYALNVRNSYWAPDNETFRPDRFLGRKNMELRYQFWRFGFGPRQ